jgi:phage terminase large subunit GpA-like protein
MTTKAAENTARILEMLDPPEDLVLSDWAEKNIVIPEGQSVRPGATRMWSYLREPINAIGDRSVERVTIMKSARVGATKALMFAMAAAAATDPGPIILLMPTDDDARDAAVSEVEPLFRSSPALKGIMRLGRGDGRNTLMRKSLAGGGSIKILSARAPRNLRRHDCRLLLCDEIDAYEVTSEGDALALAERRTMAQAQRKIVCCSTPVDENTSVITQKYENGSQEIFEVPCPECGAFNEIQWSNLEWENHDPETVKYLCPHCKELIPERHKPAMIEGGRWTPLNPEMTSHRLFKINALVSLLPNASWPQLVAEYHEAKRGGPSLMKPFHNTVLARPWRTTIHKVDASILADRAEPFGLETPSHGVIIPDQVMLINLRRGYGPPGKNRPEFLAVRQSLIVATLQGDDVLALKQDWGVYPQRPISPKILRPLCFKQLCSCHGHTSPSAIPG